MAQQRYSSVSASGEDSTDDTFEDEVVIDDKEATPYQFDPDETREEQDATAASTKSDIADTAKLKELHSPNLCVHDESDDDEADETNSHASFHPARLQLSPSSNSLLESSGHSSTVSRLLSFLHLNLNRYYVVLLVALLAISCSGTLLRELPNTPPLLKGFVYQYRQADSALIDRFLSNECLLAITVGGLAASVHFACWIWSLNHTSLAHSLFFVSCYPLVTVAVMLVQRKRINYKEIVGVLLGLAGSGLLLTDTSTTAADADGGSVVPVSVVGDIVAFMGAVVFVVYLYAGRSVRGWLPLFLYTCPMTFVSCVPLLFASLLLEDVSFRGFTPSSIFGFLAPSSLAILVLIAVLPAGLGHTGINFALQHVSPLAISVVLTLEPVLGVVVGVVAGVEAIPRWLTILGGLGSVVGCVTAIVGTHQRETTEKQVAELQNSPEQCDDVGEEAASNESREQDGAKVELVLSDVGLLSSTEAASGDKAVQEQSMQTEALREVGKRSVEHVDKG